MEELPRTRKAAKDIASRYYNTGLPCVNGHLADRKTNDGHCVECNKHRAQTEKYKEKARRNSKKTHAKNRDENLAKMKVRNVAYYQKNKEKIKAATLKYQRDNAKERTAYKKAWRKEKANSDPAFKMTLVARRMLHRALGISGQRKYKRTFDYLGYTSEELASHLERQFRDGMTWANYGEWHIDHTESLKSMTTRGITDPRELNALSNLQPLWALDNLKKGAN